jgi:hypothetical protein
METREHEAPPSTRRRGAWNDVASVRRRDLPTAEDFDEFFDEEERPEPITTHADSFEHGTTLDGLRLRVLSKQFRGGRLTAVLSGVTLDLRDAELSPEGATIYVESTLSGIEILAPSGWRVSCDLDAVMSGVDAGYTRTQSATSGPHLRVKGSIVAGGLCVR